MYFFGYCYLLLLLIVIVRGDVCIVGEIIFDKLAREYEGVMTLTVFAAYCYAKVFLVAGIT